MITMGVRQTSGLLLLPITQSTGVTIVAFSFAWRSDNSCMALQPVFTTLADKYGSIRMSVAVLLALGSVMTPHMTSSLGLAVTMGVMSAAGASAGSFSILIGLASQRVPPQRRSMAAASSTPVARSVSSFLRRS